MPQGQHPFDPPHATQQEQQNEDITAALTDIRDHLDRQDDAIAALKRTTDAHDTWVKAQQAEDADEERLRRAQEQETQLLAAKEAGIKEAEARLQAEKDTAATALAAVREKRRKKWDRVLPGIYVAIVGVLTGATLELVKEIQDSGVHFDGLVVTVGTLYGIAALLLFGTYRIAS